MLPRPRAHLSWFTAAGAALGETRTKQQERGGGKQDKFEAPAPGPRSLWKGVTMSESGDVSEFGYIMDLLARGKVSAGARGAAWAPLRALPGLG